MIRRSKVAKSDDFKVTFVLPQDEPVGPVSVVGDFNDWTPGTHILAKRTNGTRSVSVTVPKGATVRFRVLPDGESAGAAHGVDVDRRKWHCRAAADVSADPLGQTNPRPAV